MKKWNPFSKTAHNTPETVPEVVPEATPEKAAVRLPELPAAAACTGCGGCSNACPKAVISLQPDADGFLQPVVNAEMCIGCGRCEQVCPVLAEESLPAEMPSECYAFRAEDATRAVSSSGGVFTAAAEAMLRRGGAVVGAAFDEKMQLRLQVIRKAADLPPLRGSKYVQAHPGNVYREVLALLKKGVPVLFTGTPCQVAAMRQLAGTAAGELLLTMDLVCHGVPSQQTLDRYLREQFPDKTPVAVRFRDKKHGWSATHIDIDFQDGTSYSGWNKEKDLYENLFQYNVALRQCCGDCRFAALPRVGDISIGDFWGIENLDPSQNDKKGTSLVLVQTERGKAFWEEIAAGAAVKPYPELEIAKLPNRFQARYPQHAARDHFFQLARTNPLADAYRMAEENKHEIGLVGIPTVGNFGGALTYYALYRTLCRMGYSVLMIERPGNAAHKPAISRIYNKTPFPAWDVAKIYPNKQAMQELNDQCSTFLVGSDQLFNDGLYHAFGKWCTLDWVRDNKKKIAYAASFGHDYIWSSENTRAEMQHFMQKFDAFSVREESGVPLCEREFGVQAEWVLDPVFLCEPEDYTELAENAEEPLPEHYIGAYILDPTPEKAAMLSDVAEKKGLPLEVYTEMFYKESDLQSFPVPVHLGGRIEDRLASIVHSDFFIADSFHGICFAILMKKDFIAILNEKRGKSRFSSILGMLGLTSRMVTNAEDFRQRRAELLQPIDYTAVYAILDRERQRCRDWLQNAIELPGKKPYSTYDLLIQKIEALTKRVDTLTTENAALKRQMTHVKKYTGYPLWRIITLTGYLKKLKEKQENYVIGIAVKDTPGMQFTEEMAAAMQALGLQVSLVKKHWYGYAAILDGTTVIGEKCEYQKRVEVSGKTANGMPVKVISRPLKVGNACSIAFFGQGRSVNRRGINIVVYDKQKNCVCDSVCFDTHSPKLECYR